MTKKFALLSAIVVIAMTFSACTTPAAITSGVPNSMPQISVTGSGIVYVVPDIAYVYVGVRNEGDTVVKALKESSQLAKDIKDTLVALNIAEKDVQTSSFNVYPVQYDMTGQPVPTFYVVENTVYVTVRKLDALGTILDLVAKSGANSINGVFFDVSDKSKALEEARKLAIGDARKQAEQVAAAAGVKLGKLLNISLYSSGAPYPFEGKGGGGGASMMAAQVPISTGQMTISADVNLIYEIQQ